MWADSPCWLKGDKSLLHRLAMSTLDAKYVMALTGLGLTLFVVVHLGGNLLIVFGSDALNSYAPAYGPLDASAGQLTGNLGRLPSGDRGGLGMYRKDC